MSTPQQPQQQRQRQPQAQTQKPAQPKSQSTPRPSDSLQFIAENQGDFDSFFTRDWKSDRGFSFIHKFKHSKGDIKLQAVKNQKLNSRML